MTSYFVKYHYFFNNDYKYQHNATTIIDFSDGEIINSETFKKKVGEKAYTASYIY